MSKALAPARLTEGPFARALAEAGPLDGSLYALAERIFPIPRSLTGDGVRATLDVLAETLPLEVSEVPTGTQVYDWTVPQEWNVRGAWIADASGRRIADFADNPLHLVGYSVPVHERMKGSRLLEHVHWLPEHPEWIPARTSYYDPIWGFCLTRAQRDAILPDEEYEVVVDTTLEDGSLTYAELVVPGETDDEVLLSTYVCHPTLADDNVSGIAVLATLGRLVPRGLRHTYRLLFAPSTIGALAWLSRNEARLGRVRAGLIVSCVGDPGVLRYKQSRHGNAVIDRAGANVVGATPGGMVTPFVPWGGDERQFSSPGFDLPFGSLTRTPHGLYPEYHTSADDLSFITPAGLAGSLEALAAILDVLECDATLERTEPRGEPQLGRRGLYETIGAGLPEQVTEARQALLWVLNGSDGQTTLLDLAERSGLTFETILRAAARLREADLVQEAGA